MITVTVTLVYILFTIFEAIALSREKKKKELIAFMVIMSFAFIISVLLTLGVKIPSFYRFVGDIITSITKE